MKEINEFIPVQRLTNCFKIRTEEWGFRHYTHYSNTGKTLKAASVLPLQDQEKQWEVKNVK
jgi:hypothetical protein